jgi:hypothetical protein
MVIRVQVQISISAEKTEAMIIPAVPTSFWSSMQTVTPLLDWVVHRSPGEHVLEVIFAA